MWIERRGNLCLEFSLIIAPPAWAAVATQQTLVVDIMYGGLINGASLSEQGCLTHVYLVLDRGTDFQA
ncbi:hypothetical protein M378DRAFT_163056 [Amanita muscaria Koide BX008]|uniref:Uncharacterized protein n=1 Tax=Amanita muscaria (strain Koide BX008) TaxID=946122 RepID=A0A0C2TCR7_AMAMK|nr:hypothetical protein M378DRAFT_163056 [Amanita muscaria Koide BX008]